MNKPHLIISSAISLDGKITFRKDTSSTAFSALLSPIHYKILHKERQKVNAILVGSKTIITDNPKLNIRYGIKCTHPPIRISIDSKGLIPIDSKIFDASAETIIAISKKTPQQYVSKLRSIGVTTIVCGSRKVNLKVMMDKLANMGIHKLLVEGGGKLNAALLENRLVNEVKVLLMPIIIGGEKVPTFSHSIFHTEHIKLKLVDVKEFGQFLYIKYKIK